jgi:hypothetical protein
MGDLQAHIPVETRGSVVHRPKNVARLLDIRDDEMLVDRRDREPLSDERLDLVLVFFAFRDGLVEDSRVRRYAAEPFPGRAPLQFAAANHLPGQVVEPVALALLKELPQGGHDDFLLSPPATTVPVCSLVTSSTASIEACRLYRSNP